MMLRLLNDRRFARWWLVALLVVAGGTLALGAFGERYVSDPRVSLPASALADAAAGRNGWTAEGDPGVARFDGAALVLHNEADKGGVILRRRIELPPGASHVIRLGAAGEAEGIEGGKRDWRKGRVMLLPASETDRSRLTGQYELLGLRGSVGPTESERLFRIPAEDAFADLLVILSGPVGTFRLSRLSLEGLNESAFFQILAAVLLTGWAVLLASGLALVVARAQNRWAAWVLLGGGAVGAGLLIMPWELRETFLKAVSLGEINPETAANLGHFLIFLGVGACLRLARPRDPLAATLGGLCLLGGLGEVAQILVDGRSPELDDWATNTAGAVLGCIAATLLVRVASLRAAKPA